LPAYADLDEFGRGYFERAAWQAVRSSTDTRCSELRYQSGPYAVQAFMAEPAAQSNAAPVPAILYARGGTGNFGRVDALLLAELRLLAAAGFVVVVSNTRFVDALATRDEWGGADLDDVLNLVPLVRSLPQVDGRNLFMLGVSRGAMMTHLAIKGGAPLRAAAVIGGGADLTRTAIERPEFVLGDRDFDGWAKVWPDYRTKSRQLLEERSALYWPERIDVPLLIMHSRTDPMVPVSEALALALQLERHDKVYELVVYENDGHALPRHRTERNSRIAAFFRRHAAQ
jgi:dipeptidyl aminopeptidase/acylaminoacyl peptidase